MTTPAPAPVATHVPTEHEIKTYYASIFPVEAVWNFLEEALGGKGMLAGLDITLEKWDSADRGPGKVGWSIKAPDGRIITAGGTMDTILVRKMHVKSAANLRRILVNNCPVGVNMGSVYHSDGAHELQLRESCRVAVAKIMGLDFDSNDFTRTCGCHGTKMICPLCWKSHCEMIMKTLHERSAAVAGCSPLFSFSGRKGLHIYYVRKALSFSTTSARHFFMSFLTALVLEEGNTKLFDKGVTDQMDHPIRMPWTVNGHSGLLDNPIDVDCTLEMAAVHVSDLVSKKLFLVIPRAWAHFFLR